MVKFTVYGKPIAKERPRLGKGGFYTPTKSHKYEKIVAMAYKKAGFDIMSGYIGARIKIYMEIPKSRSKNERKRSLSGEIRPTAHGDVDNIVKSILDGLNKVAYEDDKFVQEIHAEKWYSETAYVEVELWTIEYD